jgi:hypothetical protein
VVVWGGGGIGIEIKEYFSIVFNHVTLKLYTITFGLRFVSRLRLYLYT